MTAIEGKPMHSLEINAIALMIILGISLLVMARLWKTDGRETLERIKETGLKGFIVHWRSLRPGQKRFVWLGCVLIAPLFPAAAFAGILLANMNTVTVLSFSEVVVIQLVLLHMCLAFLELKSRNQKK